jgi:hypothetical protein
MAEHTSDNVVEFDLLRNKAKQLKIEAQEKVVGNGGGPRGPDMSGERLGRLEGAVEGLRHSQNMMLGSVGLVAALVAVVAAFVIGFGIYELQRIDALNDKVNALPGQISTELRDLTKTLADTITAARQPAPPAPKK